MAPLLRTPRSRHSCYAVVACVLAAAVWQGCTPTKDNYAVLSFFFDGVPDPNSETSSIDPKTGEIRQNGTVSQHPPYAEQKCTECHAGMDMLTRDSSSICMKCHAKVPTEHQRMHGPVAAVACLWCHHPHESLKPYLLRDSDRKICGQCHIPGSLNATREPAHGDESRGCLECHGGHGGPKPYMLRSEGAGAPKREGQKPAEAAREAPGPAASQDERASPSAPAAPAAAPAPTPAPPSGNEGGR